MLAAWFQQRRSAEFALRFLRIEREQETALKIDEELRLVEAAATDYLANYAADMGKDRLPSFSTWFDPLGSAHLIWELRGRRRIQSQSFRKAFEDAQLGHKARALNQALQEPDPERFASLVSEVEKVVADLRHEVQVLLKEEKPKRRKNQ